jgi:two-component system KDP operon response regulator KdpE
MITPGVLVIDAEMSTRRFLRAALGAEGYCVFEAGTGEDGLVEVASRLPNVVILDPDLSDIDGLQIIGRVREWSAVPIIVLSTHDGENEKVKMLDAGADDYLSKPFACGELLARLRAALRRRARLDHNALESTLTIGDLDVDLGRRRVRVAGTEVHLTPIEYRLLATFVRYAGKVVTYGQLLREVWGPNAADRSHYVRVQVAHLRHKLEMDSARPRYLIRERGTGYRLMSA